MTGDVGLSGGLEAAQIRRARRVGWIAAAGLAVAFTVAVLVYSRFGGGFVDGLSGRVGEIVSARAQSLADSGQLQSAAEMFAEALAAEFDDPQQRVWCYRRYGEVLMRLEQWPQAAEAFQNALALNNRDWPSHRQLCEALKKQGRDEAVREAARQWIQAASGVSEQEAERAAEMMSDE